MAGFRNVALLLLAGTALTGANAAPLNVLGIANRLVRVDSTAPGTIISTVALTGLTGNDTLLGIDYRPASSRVLYGYGTSGQLYTINPLNGSAAAVGAPVAIFGTAAGIDFNPSVDRIRLVTNTNQNLRLVPDTGAIGGTDTPIAYAAGDSGAGRAPRITGAAYTNNVPGGTPTTLYVIDGARGVLATQGSVGSAPVSPNSGQLFTVGALGVASTDTVGFDIGRDGQVFATFTQPGYGTTSLYTVNLATGAATLVGAIGTPGTTYNGLAIAPAAIASYGTTANQIAVGGKLDNFVGAPSAALNTAFNGLDGLDAAGRASALSQLTPAALSLLPLVSLQTVEFEEETLRRYLRDFRAGGTGGMATPGDRKIGSFLVGSGRFGDFDADTDRARIKYAAASIQGGVDARFGPKSLVGITGGYDKARVRLGAFTPNSDISSWFAGLYGTAGVGPFYVDAFGTYGESDYDLRRSVNFAATSLAFTAKTKSETLFGGGTVGLSFDAGGFEVEPFVGGRYARLKIDGFSEGAGFGALTLANNKYESVIGTAGLRIGGAFDIGRATFRPEVRGAYRREFRKDGQRSFAFGFGGVGTDADTLTFIPTSLRRSYAAGGAGFTVSGADSPISLVVDYNGQFDRDREIHGVTGGLRYSF